MRLAVTAVHSHITFLLMSPNCGYSLQVHLEHVIMSLCALKLGTRLPFVCVIAVFGDVFVQMNWCDSTHFPFFSISPYIQPSLSSGMSRTIMSPSSKLSRVLLLPAVWGKMVRTRGLFTILFRPVATDTDLARLLSSLFPWSGRKKKKKKQDRMEWRFAAKTEHQLHYKSKAVQNYGGHTNILTCSKRWRSQILRRYKSLICRSN